MAATNQPHGRGSLGPVLAAALAVVAMTTVSCPRDPEPTAPEPLPETTVELREGWKILSGTECTAPGAAVSSPDFDASEWIPTPVPSTVLAALVRSGAVEDPYFGTNLERIAADRFADPWWYRKEFSLSRPLPSGARLVFAGINYRADVWLNGRQVGNREQLAGAFRIFAIDVRPYLVVGTNVLAVEVHPPRPGDFTVGFVDWNPRPPDNSMGLWRGVELRLTGDVSLDDVFVRSDVELETLARAALTISAQVVNHSARPVTATITATVAGAVEVAVEVVLRAREKRQLVVSPQHFPQLVLDQPRLWWPNNLGAPNLYALRLTAAVEGRVSDVREVTFGIRQVEDYFTDEGHRGYAINGKKVLIRGAGWVDDLLLADDDRRYEDQIRYVRHMNLNAIRLEGFWGSSRKLYELADRYGILIMAGWSCQWEWASYLGQPTDEYGGIDAPAEMDLIARSLRDQVVWLRNHPSVFVWVLGSDKLPRPELERRYLAQLAEVDPSRPTLAACGSATSELSGPTGVKMNGPYDYVPPNYWYLDRRRGGAWGFATETGPGPQPPPVASIQRMLPEENWWPIDATWRFHCGRGRFDDLDRYLRALNARYGEASDLRDFARKAQVANYEAMRAMFEAFSVRRPATTGIIQWMLNSAWPAMYWQLYDHYLVPNGAFYGARAAGRPVHVVYDYGQRSIVVVNDGPSALAGVTVAVRVFNLRSEILFEQSPTLDVPPGTVREVLSLPPIGTAFNACFVDARIVGSDGILLDSNLYWLSTREDVLDWEASQWFVTPIARHADLTALARLPPVTLEVEHRFAPTAGGRAVDVVLRNPGDHLAFFIELKVTGRESGRLAAPVVWDDNYVSHAPGETREIRGSFPDHALPDEEPVFHYDGWNVQVTRATRFSLTPCARW